ncbi:MAG: response regulator [Pseudomonadota bacterium]
MPVTAFRIRQMVAILIGSLALVVMSGWALGMESMVRILPDSTAMTLNTALLFLASAWCLWPVSTSASPPSARSLRGRVIGAWLVIAVSGAMLAEQGFGISLGIDWAALHQSVGDGNTHPGRAAPSTCLGFMLAGAAFLVLGRDRAGLSSRRWADALVFTTLLVGVTALLSYGLNLEGLYQVAAYHRMAAPTALGMTLLGMGLWLQLQAQYRHAKHAESPDLRIVRTAIVVLSIVVVCAGLGGFAVLKQGFEESMSASLLRTTVNSAAAFQSMLDQRIGLGRTIAERPGLQKHLARLGSHPQDADAVNQAREVGQSFLSSGISGMRIFNAQGQPVVVVGDMVDGPAQMQVRVRGRGQDAALLWQDGFVLRTTNAMVRDGKPVGSVVAEQRLTEMTAMLRNADGESASTDILMCGREQDDAVCFPSRFYKVNLHIPMYKDGKPYLAIARALLGQKGVLFVKDLRGLAVFAGYAPLGDSGLGMVFKTDSVDLFAPIRQRLNGFVVLLVLLIGGGTLLLRSQIQPLARKLVGEQQRTTAILQSSHEAFIEMDRHGVVHDWNNEAEQTFGWTQAEAIGRDLADLIIPEASREAHRRGMARFMQVGEGPVLGKRIELAALHRNGDSFMVEITISALKDGDDYRFTAFLHSIAERKQAEADLLAAKQQAESASRAKSDFLANMSHEIRTPMNAILGMLQLVHQTQLDQRQLDYLDKTEAAAKTLLGILNDILDFSKVEAGKMTLDPHPFEIDKLLRNIGVILSASVGKKDVEVLFDIDPVLPDWIVGDALRLQQVLINLAGNALKFTAHGEVVLSVRVCPPGRDGVPHMCVAVRDSGIGIGQDQLGSIFEGFSQAEASTTRRFGGTGLGLAISQRLVRLMGGELGVDSTLGVGSSFHFTIPFEPWDSPAEPVQIERMKLNGLRVLAVDDNASAREVMHGLLASFGWHVDLAGSGAEALGVLEAYKRARRRIDVVLIDWRMPDMDGWDTSLHIRSLYPDGQMPLIVMVTAYGRELLAQRQAEFPAVLDGFLVKPVTASLLYDAVADARAGQSRAVMPQRVQPVRSLRLAGMRVLVAEDNPTNQQVARELLQSEGATVTIADTGLAAIAAITDAGSVAFDVVLMDIQMPQMDGYTATREIRNRLGLHDLPIIAMTANAMGTDRNAALEAGMNDHVAKPFDLTHLIAVILRCMGRSTAEPAQSVARVTAPALGGALAPSAIDADAALARLGGNTDVYVHVLRAFAVRATELTEQAAVLAAPPQSDRQALLAALHSLKGVAATVGAQPLADLAAQMEEAHMDGEDATGVADPHGVPDWPVLLRAAGSQAAEAASVHADRLQQLPANTQA